MKKTEAKKTRATVPLRLRSRLALLSVEKKDFFIYTIMMKFYADLVFKNLLIEYRVAWYFKISQENY
jgi:hypothetical protein